MAMLIDRRYNPFRDFENIDRSFFGDNSLAEFKTDIRDIGDAYVMECDLPGFRKEDIALNLHDKVLTIKAERHSDFENAEKKGSYRAGHQFREPPAQSALSADCHEQPDEHDDWRGDPARNPCGHRLWRQPHHQPGGTPP